MQQERTKESRTTAGRNGQKAEPGQIIKDRSSNDKKACKKLADLEQEGPGTADADGGDNILLIQGEQGGHGRTGQDGACQGIQECGGIAGNKR